MEQNSRNLPRPTPETRVYWNGCREHRLLIQHCTDCGQYQFYPRILCTNCMSDRIEWAQAQGKGHVLSYTVVRRAISEAYADDVPYVVALIELVEGPKMMSNIVECSPDSVTINMQVEVIFEKWSDEISVPIFRPVNESGRGG